MRRRALRFKQDAEWLRAERFLKKHGEAHDDGSDDAYIIHAINVATLIRQTEARVRREIVAYLRHDAEVYKLNRNLGPYAQELAELFAKPLKKEPRR